MSNPIPATDEDIEYQTSTVYDWRAVTDAGPLAWPAGFVRSLIARIESDRATIAELRTKAEKDFKAYRNAFLDEHRKDAKKIAEWNSGRIGALRAEVRRLEDVIAQGSTYDRIRESQAILARRQNS